MYLYRLLDLPGRVRRRLNGGHADYRAYLFEDLMARLAGAPAPRILEVGPRDGEDTRRLLGLEPDVLTLIDLPDKKEKVEGVLGRLGANNVELIIGNLMYDELLEGRDAYDVVWCTGVLYHNPEQLRMLRRLFDLIRPGGHLVLESATARRRGLRNENCVEIWYPPHEALKRKHHVSFNITHMPSRRAIQSWMEMVGFEDVARSRCHRRVGLGLWASRAAFIGRRPSEGQAGAYYTHVDLNYEVGKAR